MRTPQTSPLRSPCQRCFPAQRRSRSGAGRFGSRRDAPNAEAKSAKETLHTTPGYTPWTTHSSCTGHKIQRISEVSGRDQDGRVWTYGLGSGGGGGLVRSTHRCLSDLCQSASGSGLSSRLRHCNGGQTPGCFGVSQKRGLAAFGEPFSPLSCSIPFPGIRSDSAACSSSIPRAA